MNFILNFIIFFYLKIKVFKYHQPKLNLKIIQLELGSKSNLFKDIINIIT